MYLESALERLQAIIGEIENKQLPLHEVIKLHEEGQKLVSHSENLLREAKGRLKVTEVGVDSAPVREESAAPQNEVDPDSTDGSLF